MLISQNKLAELTGRKLLAEMPDQSGPHRARLYDSARALETIYRANGDSAFHHHCRNVPPIDYCEGNAGSGSN
jgi:hypothetical protein